MAYLLALWGVLVVILISVGQPPTLDATRPGDAVPVLALAMAVASFLGRGLAGIAGAIAGAGSAYGLAVITALRSAERNWAFIAPGPSTVWQTDVTAALLRSLLIMAVAAALGGLGGELLEWVRRPRRAAPPLAIVASRGLVAAVVLGGVLAGTSALVAAAAQTSIVLPARLPAVEATGRDDVVTVLPDSRSPGEAQLVLVSNPVDDLSLWPSGVIEVFGPLTDAQRTSLRPGRPIGDWINNLPRPPQLWHGGVSLDPGWYAFAHFVHPDQGTEPRLQGVGTLVVTEGPAPATVTRVPGDAVPFTALVLVVLIVHGAAVVAVLKSGRNGRRPGLTDRWPAAIGLAAAASITLSVGLDFYVQFAGSPF